MSKIKLQGSVTLFVALLLGGCGSSTEKVGEKVVSDGRIPIITITLPDMDTLQDLYLSEIADSVYYTALSDEYPLPSHIRVETTDSVILAANTEQDSEDLKVYNLNGDFQKQLGARGRGPGEYIVPTWGVNRGTNEVFVRSRTDLNSLMTYDMLGESPHMVDRVTNDTVISAPIKDVVGVGRHIMMIYASIFKRPGSVTQLELTIYDPKTNTIIDSLINYNDLQERPNGPYSYATTNAQSNFCEYEDHAYYMNACSDTLYRITEKEIAPYVIFNFGEYKYHNVEPKPYTGSFEDMESMIMTNTIQLMSIQRSSNVLYAKFSYNGASFIYALNLDDGTGRYCKDYFVNDLDDGPNYMMNRFFSKSNSQTIDVSKLKITPDDDFLFPKNEVVKKMKDVDQLQRLWDDATEDSNPIIQQFKFKSGY